MNKWWGNISLSNNTRDGHLTQGFASIIYGGTAKVQTQVKEFNVNNCNV